MQQVNESPSPPLDYSFRGLECAEDLKKKGPRKAQKRYSRTPSGHYKSCCLRLNNNQICSIEGLFSVSYLVLEQPSLLTWLDLSFNQLTYLANELSSFCNLKILYLHGNLLSDIGHTLRILKTLIKLYSLTLHGNPLQERLGYRTRVIKAIPHLRSLDFTNVTHSERL